MSNGSSPDDAIGGPASGGTSVASNPAPLKVRVTARRNSRVSRRCTSRPSVNSTSARASSMPSTASSHAVRTSPIGVAVAATGFHFPCTRSSCRSSIASSRCATRPNNWPTSRSGATFPGRPASTAVCANAAATEVSVGSVTASNELPGVAAASSAACRLIASISTAVSKPRAVPTPVPWRSHRSAIRRAAGRTPAAASTPSPSST